MKEFNYASRFILTSYGILFIFDEFNGSATDTISISISDGVIYLLYGKNKAGLNDTIINQLMDLINDNSVTNIVFAATDKDNYEAVPQLKIDLTPKDIVQFVSDYNTQKTYLVS